MRYLEEIWRYFPDLRISLPSEQEIKDVYIKFIKSNKVKQGLSKEFDQLCKSIIAKL